jgi:hypothetical protein
MTASFDFDITSHVQAAGSHVGQVIQMLYDGVAFATEDNKTYEVYNHCGDFVGMLNANDVQYAICFMKKRGRAVGKTATLLPIRDGDSSMRFTCTKPSFTFAWEGWLSSMKG